MFWGGGERTNLWGSCLRYFAYGKVILVAVKTGFVRFLKWQRTNLGGGSCRRHPPWLCAWIISDK